MEYVYAALLLHKLGKQIDEAGIKKIVEAAGITPDEAKIKTLVASLKGVDIDKAVSEAAVQLAAPTTSKEEAKAEVKEEKKEAAAEGLSALFG
jgi:large subunit ribosomal protein L12